MGEMPSGGANAAPASAMRGLRHNLSAIGTFSHARLPEGHANATGVGIDSRIVLPSQLCRLVDLLVHAEVHWEGGSGNSVCHSARSCGDGPGRKSPGPVSRRTMADRCCSKSSMECGLGSLCVSSRLASLRRDTLLKKEIL